MIIFYIFFQAWIFIKNIWCSDSSKVLAVSRKENVYKQSISALNNLLESHVIPGAFANQSIFKVKFANYYSFRQTF